MNLLFFLKNNLNYFKKINCLKNSLNYLNYLKKGDYFVLTIGLFFVFLAFFFLVDNTVPEKALIYQDGKLLFSLSLNQKKEIHIPSELGISVIEIDFGKARVKSDFSAKQYCVKQGWLKKSGDIAICAPTRISLRIAARAKVYDSLSY